MLAIILSLALGADAATYDALIAAGEAAKQKQIQAKEKQIADYARTSKDASKVKGIKIRRMREELDALKAGKAFSMPELEYPLKVGAVGVLSTATDCKVLQVSGKSEMLGSLQYSVPVARAVNNRVVMGFERGSVIVWFQGIDTTGMTSDAITQMAGTYEATGTKTYTTIGGASNTVMVLKPFDVQAFEAYRAKKKK